MIYNTRQQDTTINATSGRRHIQLQIEKRLGGKNASLGQLYRAVEWKHGKRDGLADVNMGMNPTAKEE